MTRNYFTVMGAKLRFARGLGKCLPTAIALIFGGHASATMVINPSFTTAFVNDFNAVAPGDAILAENAFNAAASIFTNAFNNPITINITVDAVTGTGTLGASSTPISTINWTSLYSDVVANDNSAQGKSAAQLASINPVSGSLTATDPTGGGQFWITRAEEKALAIIPTDSNNDGKITVGTGFSYTFNDSGGVTPGTYDLTDVFAHEISEIMGRQGLSGSTVNLAGGGTVPNSYELLDALSFSGPGTRVTGNTGGSFSINDGTNLLMGFNNQAANSGDSRDWAGGTNDSFNAVSNSGVLNSVSAIDIEEMNVLGYNLTTTAVAPEPSTAVFMVTSILAGCLIRRRCS